MDRNNIPRGREKRVSSGTSDVFKRGSGLGTGKVGNGSGFPGGAPGGGSGNRGFRKSPLRTGGSISGVVILLLIIMFLSRSCGFGSGSGDSGYSQQQAPTVSQTMPQAPQQQAPQQQAPQQSYQMPQFSFPFQQQSDSSGYGSSASGNQNGVLDTSCADGIRDRYTKFTGTSKDNATVMVYMIGSDLESGNGMATADLQEMAKSGLTEQVNLLIYTGGASRWQNNIVSSRTNQVYRMVTENGRTGLERLVEDAGNKAMTDPATLTSFIQFAAKNYPSNRNILILWDHGAGSVNGYGYDEKHPSNGYMKFPGIQKAIADSGVKFDFIGFDACLMATLENALMLSKYADYMIASEETEPGTGWYYTDWLKKLCADPDISTPVLGKQIADDFTTNSQYYQRGADTTLSVIDLAELEKTVPGAFRAFAGSVLNQLKSDSYENVSNARGSAKEFARAQKIDQIDLVHFAENLGTEEGKTLASVIQDAVKYNRTSSGYERAYGLSIFFPYRSVRSVDDMTDTYRKIGMDNEYTDCIRTFANLELAGQVSAGGTSGSYESLFNSLFGDTGGFDIGSLGGGDYGYSGGYGSFDDVFEDSYGSSGSVDMQLLEQMMGLFLGGRGNMQGVTSQAKFISEEELKKAAPYVAAHSLNRSHLVWNREGNHQVLGFDENDWSTVDSLLLNAFCPDEDGYIDLGLDNVYDFDENGRLLGDFDNTWLAVNGQITAYYFEDEISDENGYLIRGYIPALVNGRNSRIHVAFSDTVPEGTVTGYSYVYENEAEGQTARAFTFAEGDTIDFICDHYRSDGTYDDSYMLGNQMIYQGELSLSNVRASQKLEAAYQITDIYCQKWWTPLM